MRSLRSPLPMSPLRVAASFAARSERSFSRSRAASTAIAFALLRCWERSSWHSATMPVGKWVMRMALSVLLTCCPPAPLARNVSMRSSAGLSWISSASSGSGSTATVHALVWMRPCVSVAGTLCRRHPRELRVGQHLARTLQVALALLESAEPLDDARHLGMLAREVAKSVHVGGDRGVGQGRVELAQPHREAFELLAQGVFH